jgi:hypothetical protein
MSMKVTPHELGAAAHALMIAGRETGIGGVRTAGTLSADRAGDAALAAALSDVCERLEYGASAFVATISMMEIALTKCGDDYQLADVKSGKIISDLSHRFQRAGT